MSAKLLLSLHFGHMTHPVFKRKASPLKHAKCDSTNRIKVKWRGKQNTNFINGDIYILKFRLKEMKIKTSGTKLIL